MVVKGGDINELVIFSNSYGGLNLTASPTNIPPTDSPYAMNVDVSPSGRVTKRKGTKVFWKELSDNKLPIFEFASNTGIKFLLSKSGDALRVFSVANDVATLLWEAGGVFRAVQENPCFLSLPGEEARVLILHSNNAPVQLRILELYRSSTSNGSTLDVNFAEKFKNTFDQVLVYRNQERVTPDAVTFDDVDNILTLDFTSIGGFNFGDDIYIIAFTYQWWAESLLWRGENFYKSVARASQTIAIPLSIKSDMTDEPRSYGITAYVNNEYDNTYVVNQKPRYDFQYGFSDGSVYTWSTDADSLIRSPDFVTFGHVSEFTQVSFTDAQITGNIINIRDHQLETLDIVTFVGSRPGLTEGQAYYVQVINENRFRLFNDPDLTDLAEITVQDFFGFNDSNVSTANNWLRFDDPLGLTIGEIYNVTFENYNFKLPEPLLTSTQYWIVPLSNFLVEVYTDANATQRVQLIKRYTKYFNSDNVNDAQNTITLTAHQFVKGDSVRYLPSSNGTAIPGLPVDVRRYVDVLNPNLIQIFADADLTIIEDLTGVGTGDHELRLDGGVHRMRISGGAMSLTKEPLERVEFARYRQLNFNGVGLIRGTNLYVSVDGEEALRNNNPAVPTATPNAYYATLDNPAFISGTDTDLVYRIGFTASEEVGLPAASIVRMVNKVPSWVGTSCTDEPYDFDSGSWVPAYGLGFYADYLSGIFPSTGTIFQNRLVLGGFTSKPSTVVFSASGDLNSEGEPYSYFQTTDDLEGLTSDPFDVSVSTGANDIVVTLMEWQNALFVFTRNNVFRTFASESNTLTAANRTTSLVANNGVVNRACVAVTDDTLLFMSTTGVYDLAPILDNEYRASEVSLKIRSKFGLAATERFRELPWVGYDSVTSLLYVGLPDTTDVNQCSVLLVYNLTLGAWTEYTTLFKFNSYMGTAYTDEVLGRQFMISNRLPCVQVFTRFNYNKYADFVDRSTDTVAGTPVFFVQELYADVQEYDPIVFTLFLSNYRDVRVFVGLSLDAMAELTWGVDFVKTNDNRIRLTTPPLTDGFIVTVPLISDTFYGAQVWIDNVLLELTDATLGQISFSNQCVCLSDIGGYGGAEEVPCAITVPIGAIAEIGYPYPAVYVSPTITQNTLDEFKRHKHVNVMFVNDNNRYTVQDVNTLTQQPADIVGLPITQLNASIAMVFQGDNNGEIQEDLYAYAPDAYSDAFTVFREPLQGVGFGCNLVVFNNSSAAFSIAAFSIQGERKFRRHVSGDTSA